MLDHRDARAVGASQHRAKPGLGDIRPQSRDESRSRNVAAAEGNAVAWRGRSQAHMHRNACVEGNAFSENLTRERPAFRHQEPILAWRRSKARISNRSFSATSAKRSSAGA